MANFTLDDIRAAAEAKYGSTDITLPDGFVVRLLNPLRLPKDNRTALLALQEAEAEEGTQEKDQEEMLRESIRLVADTATGAERLIEHCGDDLTMLAIVFEKYGEGSQVGEASGSQG
jgi:hypothetical protein